MEQKYSDEFIKQQTEFLKALVTYKYPIAELEKMDKVGWDFDDYYLATLHRQDVINILNRFSKGEFTTQQIIDWAELLDGRPSVKFESPYVQAIDNVINFLANTIDENDFPLTPERLQSLIEQLRFAETDK